MLDNVGDVSVDFWQRIAAPAKLTLHDTWDTPGSVTPYGAVRLGAAVASKPQWASLRVPSWADPGWQAPASQIFPGDRRDGCGRVLGEMMLRSGSI